MTAGRTDGQADEGDFIGRCPTKGGFPPGEMTGEIATKLFRHETIFNFHMNNFENDE